MGETLIVRRGGGKPTLKGISVKTPPTKIQYLEGETFDFSGMVISANLSGTLVDIMSGYTCTPTVMGAADTTVTISYTVNGKTATTTQVMQIKPYKPVLAENSWATIADACAKGLASGLWQVGDQKTFDIDGKSYIAKIVDFDHYSLATTDAKYGDANYNGGTNKNALTFLVFTSMGKEKMHSSANPSKWSVTTMCTQVMPQKIALLPEELQAVLRTVSIKSETTSSSAASNDKLFLPGEYEIQNDDYNTHKYQSRFAYYTAGNAFGLPSGNVWTRDKDEDNHWHAVGGLNSFVSGTPNYHLYNVCPVFCL